VSASGDDYKACVWDLRTKKSVGSLTFRDKDYRDRQGKPSQDNFMIKGAFFSNCGQYIYLLASKFKYAGFLVKFKIHPSAAGVQFSVESVLEVYRNFCQGMRQSRDGSLIQVYTCDGFLNLIEESTQKIIYSQRWHNMPIAASAAIDTEDFLGQEHNEPSHIITVSTDYEYNFIPVTGRSSTVSNAISFIGSTIMQILLLYIVLIYLMGYLSAPELK